MESYLLKVCYYIFIISSVAQATGTTDLGTNDTLSEDRQPRVIGRIVKLYSGAQPEPIYCSQEGFKADPLHCAIFYRCVRAASGRYTVFRFQCGPGTIYDPDRETCNFPQRTKRTNCGGSEIPQLASASPELPSPITSRPLYTSNLNEIANNTISETYIWATTPYQKLQSPLQSASTEYYWNTPASQIASTKMVAFKDGVEPCIKDGFMGDRQDCRKFYRCVGNQRGGFIRYEFSCSDSTVWDEDAQNCNHAWAVQRSRCGRINTNLEKNYPQSNDVLKNKENTPNTVQEQLQVNYGNKVSQTQTQISHGPVVQNQSQINYGNRENTNQSSRVKQNQTQISYGSAISQTQTQINHGDSAVQTQLQIDHTKDTSQTQTTVTNVEADDSNQGYGNQPVETSNTEQSGNTENDKNECTQSGFMGDSNDCNRFYRCVDNGRGGFVKYDFTCGEGTVWDSSIESCNHAWAVPKCGGKEPVNSSPQAVTQTTTTMRVTESPNTTTQNSAVTDDNEDHGYDNQKPQQELSSSATEQSFTSIRPNEGNKCNSSGFMGDKNNCKKFYRCVDNGNGGYTKYEFSCGEGTVWDSKIEACNHVWAVEKCGDDDSDVYKETTSSAKPTMYDETTNDIDSGNSPQSSSAESSFTNQPEPTSKPTEKPTERPTAKKECTQEGFMGDEEDCKKFHRCVNDGHSGFIKYEFSCGEGTIWDSEITACNHPNLVKRACNGETSNQTENITEISQETSSGTETTTTTEESVPTKNPSSTAPSSKECSQEGFMGDDKDCKKFYRCVNNGKGGFTKYDFICGDNTIWNQDLQTCDHKTRHTNCSKDFISESQTTQSTTETTEQQSPSTETNAQPTPKPDSSHNETHAKCTNEGFYANPNDCKKFYRCVDNGKGEYTKYDFSCGDGTMWVQEIQACDHDNDGTCSSSQNEQSPEAENGPKPQYTSTSTESPAGQPPHKQDDEKPEDSPNSNNNDDGEKCSSEGFYANKEDCQKFYRCVDNGNGGFTKYDFKCGEGTAWDSELQTCNHVDQVVSCQGQENQSKPESEQSTTTTSSPLDDSSQSSISGETGTESPKPANKDKCEQEGFYGNSQDCKKFYRCIDNGKGGFTKYDFDCGEGTIWDQDVQTCNHPQDVANPSCQQNAGSESSSTSSTTESSSSSSSSATTSTTESNNGSDCSTKKPTKNDVNCTKAGYYPDPNDCKKFYRCVDWDGNGEKFSVYHFECGEGTIWDPALDTCNHEDSVYPPRDCSGSQSQSENAGEETTTSQTTTQQSTTAPPQTEQSTTEQTTTEQNTDRTTAQQTEQSTTEETTTQKLTTSEQTEQTTTQESTTSDHSETTQHTEETTTEQTASIIDQTTTQHTTEQTTTQESTTSESTTEQSTTEESTTEQSTTEQSTTEQSTTEQSTTEQSTTEQSTTEQSTTGQSTTEESTTEHSSNTTENTTQESTEGTTQESTSEHSTTTQTDNNGTTVSTSTTESTEESTTENGGDQTTESPSSEKECPETEDDQNLFVCPTSFKRHPKYCNMFYQCTEDDDTHDVQVATFRCPNETIYDESQTKCVEEKKAEKKCDGEIAQKRRIKRFDTAYKEPITISNERLKCPASGHYPFEKENCSPAFLKCKTNKSGILRGYVHQCPQNYVYWSVSRRCEHKDSVKDCKKSYNDWSGRWEIPIERRNVAP